MIIKDQSYIELCLHLDGKEDLYLRIPTVWDDIIKEWRGFIKTPQSQKLIHAYGKDSFELQNNFIRAMSEVFEKQDSISKELFEMFMPAFYWEEK